MVAHLAGQNGEALPSRDATCVHAAGRIYVSCITHPGVSYALRESNTGRPAKNVAIACVSSMSSGHCSASTSGLRSNAAMSAHMPAASFPISFSRPAEAAGRVGANCVGGGNALARKPPTLRFVRFRVLPGDGCINARPRIHVYDGRIGAERERCAFA